MPKSAANKVKPKVRVERRDARNFISESVTLFSAYKHFKSLFESGELRIKLLEEISPILLGDIASLLRKHLVLSICAITEQASSFRRDNLSTWFFVENAAFPNHTRDEKALRKLAISMDKFRRKLKPARDRYISHLDLKSLRRKKSLGAASVQLWEQFWNDLREFLRILHRRYVMLKPVFDLFDITGLSDADSLVNALKESTYFHALITAGMAHQCLDIAETSKYSSA